MTKSDCIQCGGAARYSFEALEIHTLHVRDLKGEKRVQALGSRTEFHVCADCAQKQLQKNREGVHAKQLLPFAAILLLGIVCAAAFWNGEGAFRLFGTCGVICGILGIVSTAKGVRQRQEQYDNLPEEDALEKAAWEVAVLRAPRKQGDHDLTYLPITQETLAMKNGDLMIAYNLLPDIAVQAWNTLHPTPQDRQGTEDSGTASPTDGTPS